MMKRGECTQKQNIPNTQQMNNKQGEEEEAQTINLVLIRAAGEAKTEITKRNVNIIKGHERAKC